MRHLTRLAKALMKQNPKEAAQVASLVKVSHNSKSFFTPEILSELSGAAQATYDDWIQDKEGYSENFGDIGYGGICHIIADKIIEVLDKYNVDSKHSFCSITDYSVQHVYVLAYIRTDQEELEEENPAEGEEERESRYDVWSVDIPYYIYETGGGYNWKKIPDVKFGPNDVNLYLVESGLLEEELEKYNEY